MVYHYRLKMCRNTYLIKNLCSIPVFPAGLPEIMSKVKNSALCRCVYRISAYEQRGTFLCRALFFTHMFTVCRDVPRQRMR